MGGLLGSHHGLIVRLGFVTLLGRHDALVVEVLHAVVRLLGDVESRLSLLPKLVGTGHFLRTGASHGLGALCLGGRSYGFGLTQFGVHLGGVQVNQRVAGVHAVALAEAVSLDTSGHLAGDTYLGGLCLTHDNVVGGSEQDEACQ